MCCVIIYLPQAELPFWRIIMFWSGTCLKEIAADSLVWATLAIYVGIRIFANLIDYVPDSVALLSKTNIGILGGFLSFFLVLFVNQTNGRFLEMYGFSKACSGRIQGLATVRYGKTTIQRKVSSLVRDAAVDMGKLIVSCVESLKQRKLLSLAFEACRDLEGVLWLSEVTEYSLTQELVTENRCIRVTEQTARTERKPKPVYTETPQFNPAHDETFLCVVSKMNGVSPEQTRREVSRLKRLSQPVPATPRARVRKRIYRSRNAVAHNVYARYQPSAFLNVLSSTRVSFPKWTEPTGATPSFKRGSASARMIGVRTCKQFRFV